MAFINLKVHFVWSTRNRRPFLHESFREELFNQIGGIAKQRKHILLAVGGVDDHIHLLVGFHQSMSVADFVRDTKSNTTLWIKKHQPNLQMFAWQTKYAAFSVSESNVEAVVSYIDKQEEHHKKVSFQEEFLRLLEKHKIQFDARFVWE